MQSRGLLTQVVLSVLFLLVQASGTVLAQNHDHDNAAGADSNAQTATQPVATATDDREPAADTPAPLPAEPPKAAPQATAPGEAEIPPDAVLAHTGARIGHIDIQVNNIFDRNNPKENSLLYRAANALHITSRDNTIRTQLLFKPGDVYARHLLDETARNLRARSYLNDATITPVRYHPEDNTVDVLVQVRDVWTLNVGASYGRSGGANHSGVQIEDGNLLGYGKDLTLEREDNVDRSIWSLSYSDPNLFSSRWQLDTSYASASDGGTHSFKLAHPFFSLDTRWSAQVDGLSERQIDRRYDMANIVDQYETTHENYGVAAGWSTGLSSGWVHRVSLGYRNERYHYAPDPVLGTLQLPDDQRLAYPWIGYQLLEDHYEVARNRDLIGRTEDVYDGRSLSLQVGDVAPAFGADRKALLIQLQAQDAWHLSDRQSLFFTLTLNGRREGAQWRGTLLTTVLRYDFRRSAKNLFTASLTSDNGEYLDQSQLLYLDGDHGLRGYPLYYRSGSHRNVLTLEQRLYTDWQILRLLTVGGAAFVDVGQISGGDPSVATGSHVLSDIGVGLRFGNIRSSRGEVFHVDVAYPLNAPAGIGKLQFLVVTKKSF